MKSVLLCLGIIFSSVQLFAQSEDRVEAGTEAKILDLPEVIGIARDQSLMALMSRHQFRSSYWEYRTHLARFRPGIMLDATIPSINNST